MDETQTIEHIGQAIRQLRVQRGWKQSELGEKVGKAPEAISMIENGKDGWTNMKLDTVALFADAFDLHSSDLIAMLTRESRQAEPAVQS